MGLEQSAAPPKGAKHAKKRVGRGQGSGNGKTAGRGHKGAKSRSGFKFKRGFEGGQMPLHRRVPKRGFHNPFRVEYEVVNLDTLGERFDAGTVVTPELLRERGPGRTRQRSDQGAGARRDRKALTVRAHKFSGKAAEKIAAAGGHDGGDRVTADRSDRPGLQSWKTASRTSSPFRTCATACSSRSGCSASTASGITSRRRA